MCRAGIRIFVVALLVPLATLSAQLPVQVEPGSRLKVKPKRRPEAVYDLIRVEDDALVVLRKRYDAVRRRTRHDSLHVPFAGIERLKISRGRDPAGVRALRGAKYGALVFGGLGAILGAVGCSGGTQIGCTSAPEGAALLGGLFGTVGGLFGALFGVVSRGERWEEIPLDRVRVRVARQRDGQFRVRFSVAF